MKYQLIALAIGIALIGSTGVVSDKPEAKRFDFYPPPQGLEHFTLGYNENISDSLWIRVIQNIDTCENAPDGMPHSESTRALRQSGQLPQTALCKKGWVFQMINAITLLTPEFRMPYIAGGTSLSVLVDDAEGAAIIFERAVKQFPHDWSIAYHAGHHFLEEMKQPEKAAEFLYQAARNGAPHWVYALAGRLYTETGRAFYAKTIYEEALARDPSGLGAPLMKKKLDEANRILARGQSLDSPEAIEHLNAYEEKLKGGNRADAQPEPKPESKVPQFLRKTN